MRKKVVSFPERLSLDDRSAIEEARLERQRRRIERKVEREFELERELARKRWKAGLAIRRVCESTPVQKYLNLLSDPPAVFAVRSQPYTRGTHGLLGHVIASPDRLPFLPGARGVRWDVEK